MSFMKKFRRESSIREEERTRVSDGEAIEFERRAHILVPLDGSDVSLNALRWATEFARVLGADIRLLHAVDREFQAAWEDNNKALLDSFYADGGKILRKGKEFCKKNKVKCVPQIVLSEPVSAIVDASKKAELVIMGSHGRSGMKRMAFGSVTEEVLRSSYSTVLAVREDVKPHPGLLFNDILVPYDGSRLSYVAFKLALAIGRVLDSKVTCCHVATSKSDFQIFDERRKLEEEGNNIGLDVFVEELTPKGRQKPEDILVERSRETELILMGTHGRVGVDRIILGSVTEHLLRNCKVPVMAVNEPKRNLLPIFDEYFKPIALNSRKMKEMEEDPRLQILVPVDGSKVSKAAVEFAAKFAHMMGGKILLLFAADKEFVTAFEGKNPQILAKFYEDAEEVLQHARDICHGEEVPYSCTATLQSPVEAIVSASETCDIVVMGTHGRSGLKRVALGSVTESVIRRSDTPVLVLRGHTKKYDPKKTFKKVLLPYDGSFLSKRAIELASMLVALRKGEITLFTTIPKGGDEKNLSIVVKEEVRMLNGMKIDASEKIVEQKSEKIGNLINKNSKNHDCIVIGHNGRKGVERAITGSVTDTVIRSSDVPVLVVKKLSSRFARLKPNAEFAS